MHINKEKIKNILVVRNDRFGEFLLNIPALRALKETFTNAKIIAVVDPYVKELADCIDFINEIMEWERKKHSFREKLSFINQLKKRNMDMAVILNPSKEFNVFTYLAAIPIRVGYDRKWGFLLTHKIMDRKYLGLKHEVDYNLELVSLVGAKTDDKTLHLKIDDDSTNTMKSSNLIAIHPWTSDQVKQWPLEYFRVLTERLVKELNVEAVIVGGKKDQSKSREIFTDFGEKVADLTGKISLIQLAAILKKCRLLISGDSGPVHLACAMGTPVIALFRSDIAGKSARRWGPWGEGHIVIEKPNLNEIKVEEVLEKVRSKLKI